MDSKSYSVFTSRGVKVVKVGRLVSDRTGARGRSVIALSICGPDGRYGGTSGRGLASGSGIEGFGWTAACGRAGSGR